MTRDFVTEDISCFYDNDEDGEFISLVDRSDGDIIDLEIGQFTAIVSFIKDCIIDSRRE